MSQQSRAYLTPEQHQWIAATITGSLILILTLKGLSGNPTGQALFSFLEIQGLSWWHLAALKNCANRTH